MVKQLNISIVLYKHLSWCQNKMVHNMIDYFRVIRNSICCFFSLYWLGVSLCACIKASLWINDENTTSTKLIRNPMLHCWLRYHQKRGIWHMSLSQVERTWKASWSKQSLVLSQNSGVIKMIKHLRTVLWTLLQSFFLVPQRPLRDLLLQDMFLLFLFGSSSPTKKSSFSKYFSLFPSMTFFS